MDQAQRDAHFRSQMIAYIRRHFADVLGEHVALLDREDGLDTIAELLQSGRIGTT
jgi:hypothetical protein